MRTRTTVLLVAMIAGAMFVLGGCGDDADDSAEDPGTVDMSAEIADSSFVSQSVEGHELVPGSSISLRFEGDTMAVNAGCNTMSGTYVYEAGTLSWPDAPAATMMACETPLMDQDTWLVELFTTGVDLSTSDDAELVAESGDVRTTFTEE